MQKQVYSYERSWNYGWLFKICNTPVKTIFLLTKFRTDRVSYWSGIPSYVKASLIPYFRVIELTPSEWPIVSFSDRVFTWIRVKLGFRYRFQDSILIGLLSWPYMYYKLKFQYRNQSNTIFALAVSSELLFVPGGYKKILFADATMSQLFEYPEYQNVYSWSKFESRWTNKTAINQLNHMMVTSNWAKMKVLEETKLKEEKVTVAPFGLNIVDGYTVQMTQNRLKRRNLTFLFPCTNWVRKGGNRVLEILEHLSTQSRWPVELVIYGNSPELSPQNDFKITKLGWINKSNPKQVMLLQSHLETSDFIILPTKADTTPLSVIEGMCYGLPIITAPIGAIHELLPNPEVRFFDNTQREAVSSWILERAKNEAYIISSKAIRHLYELNHSWKFWGRTAKNIIDKA